MTVDLKYIYIANFRAIERTRKLASLSINNTYRYVQTLLIEPFDPATVNCIIIIYIIIIAHIKHTDITQGRSHKMRTLTPRIIGYVRARCIVRCSYTLSETGGLGLGQTTATVGGTRCACSTHIVMYRQ